METNLTIRPMLEGEKQAVRRLMRRAFSAPAWIFITWSKDALVAEHEGRIVGCVLLDIFDLPSGRRRAEARVGFIAWLCTDPDARGLGAGQALVEGALALFEARGCTEFAACVEGYNTSSSNLFATRGFSVLSMGEQVRRYGLSLIPYWWHASHFMDVGHFLWVKPGAERPDSPTQQWIGMWLVNGLLLWVALWRRGAFAADVLWTIPAALLLLFGLRSAAMWGAAQALGLAVRFRAWESASPLVAAIALGFGGFFPFPGSFYPVEERWRYRDLLPKIGPMALAGALVSVLLAWGSWTALRWNLAPGLNPLLYPLASLSSMLAVLETVIAFFPLISFNGRRIWDWNRAVWAVVSLAAVALLVIS